MSATDRLTGIAKALSLLSIAFFFAVGGVIELQLRPWLIGTAKKAEATLDYAGRAAKHIDSTASIVDDAAGRERDFLANTVPELSGKIDGAISDARLSIGHANDLLGSLRQTSDSFNDNQRRIADAAVGALGAARETISDVQPVLAQAKAVAVTTDATVSDIDRFVTSPDLVDTEHSFSTTSANMAYVSTDFKTRFHEILYPPKCEGKLCALKRALPIIRDGAGMAEPAYWVYQLVQAVTH